MASCEHKKLSGSEIEIQCEISSEEFRVFEIEAVKEFASTIEIPGFRKGKAPPELIKEKIPQDRLLHRTAEMAVQKVYPQYVLEEKLNVIGTPEVSILKLASGNPFEFKLKVATVPEVQLGDYKKISKDTAKERTVGEPTQEETNQTIEWLLDSKATASLVSRGAALGDKMEIDFEGKKDGITLEKFSSRSHPLTLGKTKLIPGLEEALKGMKEGEEKTVALKLPDNFTDKALQGAHIDLHVKITSVEEKKLPELNDDFAKSLGKFENLQQLKTNITSGLKEEKEQKERERIRALMAQRIAEQATIELPRVLVETELDRMMGELETNVQEIGLSLKDYLSRIGKDESTLRKEWTKDAERRARIGLVLREIAKKENLYPNEEEIDQKMNDLLTHYASPEAAREKIDLVRLREYTRGILRNEKVFEFLESLSTPH